jgi:hypothetical protein
MAFQQSLVIKGSEVAPIREDLQIGFREGAPMIRNSTKYVLLFALCIFGGLIGGIAGSRLGSGPSGSREAGTIRVSRMELTDDQGRTRAVLGSDKSEVFLKMLSPDGDPVISASIPNAPAAYSRDRNVNDSSSLYPSPALVIKAASGKGDVSIEVNHNGDGRMSFIGTSANESEIERVSVGRLTLSDVQPDAGGWGMLVKGRGENGSHLGTAVGIYANDNRTDGRYIVPVTR